MRAPRARLVVLLLATACAAAAALALEVPYLSGRVNDTAGLLSPQTAQQVETKLAELEEATGAQVAVLTLPGLEGEPLEDFSLRVVETWKLGRKEHDDGVLLLVSRDDRKVRIEVGYGLEPELTDAMSKRIISNLMVPRFREGDFDGGVTAAVDAIDAVVRGQEDLIPPQLADTSGGELDHMALPEKLVFLAVFGVVIGTFSLIGLATPGCTGWFLYLFLMPFYAAFPTAAFGPAGGAVALGAWVIGFPILRLWAGKTASGRTFQSWFPAGTSSGGSSGGWSSGGFSGGFSGGGGSFGGGGASGSW